MKPTQPTTAAGESAPTLYAWQLNECRRLLVSVINESGEDAAYEWAAERLSNADAREVYDACNSHAELLAALRDLAGVINEQRDELSAANIAYVPELASALQAIARAEGRP